MPAPLHTADHQHGCNPCVRLRSPTAAGCAQAFYDPAARDAKYSGDWAQYLVDMHDARATFDFCGGMMFQLVLSDKLRSRLADAAKGVGQQPVVFSELRMMDTPGYSQSAEADNVRVFHGREVRSVADAAGGMGMALHLSDTDEDPEGWSAEERADYDGWGHDSGRPWRNVERWEGEGFVGAKAKFGAEAFGLHHRFFLHSDASNHFWLSAEDGCEGFACAAGGGRKRFGLF